MQSLKSTPMAHEAEEYPAMNESTTDLRIVAEVAGWIDDHAHLKDDRGRRQVVRNGHLPERAIQTGIGPIEVQQPRVRDRRPADQREAFPSAILPPYLRKTRSL